MSSLETLPYEINSQILSLLPRCDLLRISLVSHALHDIADSVLYRTPCVRLHLRGALIRTLLTPGRGVLAVYVTQLSIEGARSRAVERVIDVTDEGEAWADRAEEGYLEEAGDSDDSEGNGWAGVDENRHGNDVHSGDNYQVSDDDDVDVSDEASDGGDTGEEGNVMHSGSKIMSRETTDDVHGVRVQREASLYRAAVSRFGLIQQPFMSFLLLLHLLPHLQQLTIGNLSPADRCTDTIGAISHAELTAGLQSLREFTSVQQGISSATFCKLLTLPRIRSIVVSLSKPYEHEDNPDDADSSMYPSDISTCDSETIFPSDISSCSSDVSYHRARSPWSATHFLAVASGTSTVTALRIRHTALASGALEHILTIPRALERFRYDCSYRSPDVDLTAIGRALLPLRSTLQALWLGCGHHPVLDATHTIGTLCGWPELYTVRVSLVLLLGGARRPGGLRLENLLPAGLRVLQVLPDKEWSLEAAVDVVVRLLRMKRVVLPMLESVAVLREVPKREEMWNMLVAACEDAGVELVPDILMD